MLLYHSTTTDKLMRHNPNLFLIEAENCTEQIDFKLRLEDKNPLSKALNVLALLGGVASISVLKKHGIEASDRQLSRSLSRSKKIRPLGAGYFALHTLTILHVEEWIKRLLTIHARLSTTRCVELVLCQYPHGDRAAITRWLCNRHSDIKVHRGHVTLA